MLLPSLFYSYFLVFFSCFIYLKCVFIFECVYVFVWLKKYFILQKSSYVRYFYFYFFRLTKSNVYTLYLALSLTLNALYGEQQHEDKKNWKKHIYSFRKHCGLLCAYCLLCSVESRDAFSSSSCSWFLFLLPKTICISKNRLEYTETHTRLTYLFIFIRAHHFCQQRAHTAHLK